MTVLHNADDAGFRLSIQQQHAVAAQMEEGRLLCATAVVDLGKTDAARLRAALDRMIGRHEILRTVYRSIPGLCFPIQVPQPQLLYELSEYSGTDAGEGDLSHALRAARQRIDLDRGPIASLTLIRSRTSADRLILALPLIAADRTAVEQLLAEICSAYAQVTDGTEAPDVQYVDYAEWQHSVLHGEQSEQGVQFWRTVRDFAPFDAPVRWESGAPGRTVASHIVPWDERLEQSVAKLERENGLDREDVLLFLWSAFVARLQEQSRMTIAVAVDARGAAVENVLGSFALRIPVALQIDPSASVRKNLRMTSLKVEECRSWLHYFQDLPAGNAQRAFRYSFAFSYAKCRPDLRSMEVEVDEPCDVKLRLEYCEPGHLRIAYPASLFGAEALALWAAQLRAFIRSAAEDANRNLADVKSCGAEERRKVVRDFNPPRQPDALQASCLHQLIEARVASSRDAPALLFGTASVSYGEINARANRLARLLRSWGVGPDVLIAICVERSVDLVVGLLGILKAGGAYLPVDPTYPRERIACMLGDARPRAVLTQERLLPSLPNLDARVWCFDRDADDLASYPNHDLPNIAHPRNLAYCIYTSGSTGRPKGCQIEHASLTNYVCWADRHYFEGHAQGGSFALYSSLSFDLTVTSLFVPLIRGRSLRIYADDLPVDAILTQAFLRDSGLDAIKLTPSHISLLKQLGLAETGMDLAIVGGEALIVDQVRVLHDLNPRMRIHNEYGPTEATVGCVVQLIERGADSVPIGCPIDNFRAYVLDAHGDLAPIGTTGELYVGGVGLARGYHARPSLTAERFVPDACGEEGGQRLYRTGDLVRYRPDGILEYVGRADSQVKVRGYRIEIGEIEVCLTQMPEVRAAAVVAREGQTADKRLVAYVVAEPTAKTGGASKVGLRDRLRERLQQQLPEYMVPAQYVFLDKLPLSANGKVDRKALPAPEAVKLQHTYVAPGNDLEAALAQIWRQVLNRDCVGVQDNFFELGGDSIVAIQVVSKARSAGIRFTPRDLFQHQRIAELARVATRAHAEPSPAVVSDGEVPLTPIQRWFFELPLTRRDHWNQSVLLKVAQPLQAELLERSLQTLVAHHDSLRLQFARVAEGVWRQRYGGSVPSTLSACEDLSRSPAVSEEIERVANEAQRGLSISDGRLIRAVQMTLPDGSARLLVVIHHLAVDGVSWRILLEDLQTIYRALESNAPVELPAKSSALLAWSHAIQRYAYSEQLTQELEYWREVVGPNETPAPSDRDARPHFEGNDRSVLSAELNAEDTQRLLKEANPAYRTQINDLLLTALAVTLCDWTEKESVLLELEGHGREDLFEKIDVTRTVGWFTTLYPVRLAPGKRGPGDAIKSIKEQLRGVPGKGVGFGVLKYLRGCSELQYAPGSVTARFNYLGQLDASFEASGSWQPAEEFSGKDRAEPDDAGDCLDLVAMVYGRTLRVSCEHRGSLHSAGSIQALLNRYIEQLRLLADHCTNGANSALTPADFPLAGLAQSQLDELPVLARDVEDIYPLSPMQQGLLLHSLLNPGSGIYLMQDVFHAEGVIDPEAFRHAWDRVVARHTILRTSFLWSADAAPVQIVHRNARSAVSILDWSGMERPAAEERMQAILREERAEQFDFSQPPLLRLRLIKLADEQFLVVKSFHHVLMDAWCIPLLFRDFFAFYAAERGDAPAPGGAPRPYRDFIEWLGRQDRDASRRYWREELAGFNSITPLPFATKSPAVGSLSSVADVIVTLTEADTSSLVQLAQQHQLTVNTIVQGAWALLLALHSGQEEVLFGVTVAGRPTELEGIHETLGLFINSIPLRVQLPRPDDRVSALDWLRALLNKNAAMRQHEHLSLVEIQATTAVARDTSLFDSLFVFENAPFHESVRSAANAFGIRELSARTHTNYPLTVVIGPGSRLLLQLSCDLRFFDVPSMERLLAQFQHVLLQLVAHAHAPLRELPMLMASERAVVLDGATNASGTYSLSAGFVERFEACVRSHASKVAARWGDDTVSYDHLNAAANRVGHALLERGVRRDEVVVIYAERDLDLLRMILGVFKSGAGYLVLEPGTPAQRMKHTLLLTQPRVVLSTDRYRGRLEAVLNELPVEQRPAPLTLDREIQRALPQSNPGIYCDGNQLAYVIYTSGSTGVPKGVMVEQAGMLNNQLSKIPYLGLDERDVIAQTASCSFDISVWQLLTGLLCGARIEMVPDEIARDPARLLRYVQERGIKVLESVPSLIQGMLSEERIELTRLRCLIATGEALSPSLAREWLERYPGVELVNAYGPAECSDDVSMHRLTEPGSESQVPIGRATENNQLYLLNGMLQPVPIGATGEIHAAGTGVGRGYFRDPRRTAEAFIANPYGKPGERLYRTGDLARFRADGVLEYLGRNDQQVKIRGCRIELGEIESRLREHEAVQGAAVVALDGAGGMKRLVAYVVPTARPAFLDDGRAQAALRERLREHLQSALPEYMVPGQYVWLTELPLNANGKVDRRALPAPESAEPFHTYVAPSGEIEEQLAEIWMQVLKVERVGAHDNFFDLGGHSLLVTQVVSRIRNRFGIELPLRTPFEATSIAALAQRVEGRVAESRVGGDVALMSTLLEELEAEE